MITFFDRDKVEWHRFNFMWQSWVADGRVQPRHLTSQHAEEKRHGRSGF
jgi:hypothetical protein